MIVALAVVCPICFTVLVVSLLAVWHRQPMTFAERRARADLRVAETKTKIEVERWKQDWVLDQRNAGHPPALPPGTQTTMRY